MIEDLAVRHRGPGHVESWFVRANDPAAPRAVWLKVTILAPLHGPPVAEAWLVAFDSGVHAWRDTAPLAEARFDPPTAAGLTLGPDGASGQVGPARVHLTFVPTSPPLSILPRSWLDRGFPRSKLLSPIPAMRVSGTVTLPHATWDLNGWDGMLGHNWGREHTWEYAWGHCVFPGDVLVEGFSARVKVGPLVAPRLSALVVREGGQELRFDRLFDPWRQRATLSARTWSVSLQGPDGRATLEMDASNRPIACLGYGNPDGRMSYCFNSKLATTVLTLEGAGGARTYRSEHGGALELLRREAEEGVTVV